MILRKFNWGFIFLGISFFIFFIGFLNFRSSMLTKDYICVPGAVKNVEIVHVRKRTGFTDRYNYTIQWQRDGKNYSRLVQEAISKPDKSCDKVWVSSDNTEVITASPSSIRKSAIMNFIVALLCGIAGLIALKKEDLKTKWNKEKLEDLHLTMIMLGGIIAFMIVLLIAILNTASNLGYSMRVILKDIVYIMLGVFVVCVVVCRKVKKRLKY